MRVDGGLLSPGDSPYVQNWDNDNKALTHTEQGSKVAKERGILNGRRQQKKKALSHSG